MTPDHSIRPPGLFVTGTGTEVGKTEVACCIARTLVAQGLRVGTYKPAASGYPSEEWETSSDQGRLWNAAGGRRTISDVCPQSFAAPLAPHLAARAEGKQIDERLLICGLDVWRSDSDFLLVEGAGGLLSPLGEERLNADLASEFGLPLLVVSANVLGTINHTLQTLAAARRYCPQLPIVGVVLSEPQAEASDVSRSSNADQLAQWLDVPLLGVVPHGAAQFDRPIDWLSLVSAR